MPYYDYKNTTTGERTSIFMTISEMEKRSKADMSIEIEGVRWERDLLSEHSGSGATSCAIWPMKSDAAGIHPNQVGEFRKDSLKKAYRPTLTRRLDRQFLDHAHTEQITLKHTECTIKVEATVMADEEKNEEKNEEYNGPFAGMDFDEPDEQELYGFEEGEESEENEEECEDCEEEEDNEDIEFFDPDNPQVEAEEQEYEEEQQVQEGLQAELVALAKAQGLSDDEIRSIGSDSALGTIIAALQRRAVEETTESAQEQQSDAVFQEAEESRKALAEIESLNADDHFDPVAAKAIKALHSELQRVRDELSQVGGVAFSASSEQGIVDMAGKYPEVLGNGPTSELEPSSDYARNRSRLLDEVSVLRAGYAAAKSQCQLTLSCLLRHSEAYSVCVSKKLNEIGLQRKSRSAKSNLLHVQLTTVVCPKLGATRLLQMLRK